MGGGGVSYKEELRIVIPATNIAIINEKYSFSAPGGEVISVNSTSHELVGQKEYLSSRKAVLIPCVISVAFELDAYTCGAVTDIASKK